MGCVPSLRPIHTGEWILGSGFRQAEGAFLLEGAGEGLTGHNAWGDVETEEEQWQTLDHP